MKQTQTPGLCETIVTRRIATRTPGMYTDHIISRPDWCQKAALPGGALCQIHQTKADAIEAALAARKARLWERNIAILDSLQPIFERNAAQARDCK